MNPAQTVGRVRGAFARDGVSGVLGGFWIQRHFRGRARVSWVGGRPAPKFVNRGGRLETGGCKLFNGVRLEVGPGARLYIGKGTYLNRNTTVVCHESVWIGRDCLISWDVVISDTNEHEWPGIEGPVAEPVRIDDRVWIGCRAIVLRGVTIGEGSVIGAGSVVTKDIPPWSLAAGQPARVIRSLRPAGARAPGLAGDG